MMRTIHCVVPKCFFPTVFPIPLAEGAPTTLCGQAQRGNLQPSEMLLSRSISLAVEDMHMLWREYHVYFGSCLQHVVIERKDLERQAVERKVENDAETGRLD